MENLVKKIQSTYEYKYLGEQNYIDINTLLTSQFHFAFIVNEIQKEIFPNENLKIKIQSFKDGTFNVTHIFELCSVGLFYLSTDINYFTSLFSVLSDYLSIKLFLKDKTADDIKEHGNNKVEINISHEGQGPLIIEKDAFNIYQKNEPLDTAIRKNIQALDEDEEIEGVEIREKGHVEPRIYLSRKDFPILSCPNGYMAKETKEEISKETLFIKRADHFPKNIARWGFIHHGRPITASITDGTFIAKINDGERFGQGDSLEADIKVFYKWDDRFQTYIESGKFEVTKVHRIIRREHQTSLFSKNNAWK